MYFSNTPILSFESVIQLSLLMYKYKDLVISRYNTRRDNIWLSVRNSKYPPKKWEPTYDIKNIGIHYIDDDGIKRLSHGGHNIQLGSDSDVTNKMAVCVFHYSGISPRTINEHIPIYYTDGAYACEWQYVAELLDKFAYGIKDLCFPPQHRIEKKLLENFIVTIHNKVDNDSWYRHSSYSEWDDKYGIWSCTDIYKYVEWDFEMIEKYKEYISWAKILKVNENLEWDEEHFEKYHNYLLQNIKWGKVCAPNNFRSIIPFSFLWKYRERLDFEDILSNGNLSMTIEQIKLLFDWIKDKRLSYSHNVESDGTFKNEFYSMLLRNKNFVWEQEVLKFCSKEGYENSKLFWHAYKNTTYSTALNTTDIIDDLINIKEHFASTKQRNIAYDFYERYKKETLPVLTSEIVTHKAKKWNDKADLQFVGYSYGSDIHCNYHEVTGWEKYVYKKYALTYDACKILKDTTLRIGGHLFIDKEEDPNASWQEFKDDSYINALYFCSHNEIVNQDELNLIINDASVLEFFIKTRNLLVLDYAIETFFSHYSYENFIAKDILINYITPIDSIDIKKIKGFRYFSDNFE